MNKIYYSKMIRALILLILVFTAGVVGFKMLFDYPWIDAAYMTVITLSTVGFGELHELSQFEKIFTSIFIISSIFIVGYAFSVITEFIINRNSLGLLKKKRVEKRIKSMKNHVILCGFGRNGKQAGIKLMAYNRPFIVIEKNEEVVARFEDEQTLFIHGDASEDEVLLHAGI